MTAALRTGARAPSSPQIPADVPGGSAAGDTWYNGPNVLSPKGQPRTVRAADSRAVAADGRLILDRPERPKTVILNGAQRSEESGRERQGPRARAVRARPMRAPQATTSAARPFASTLRVTCLGYWVGCHGLSSSRVPRLVLQPCFHRHERSAGSFARSSAFRRSSPIPARSPDTTRMPPGAGPRKRGTTNRGAVTASVPGAMGKRPRLPVVRGRRGQPVPCPRRPLHSVPACLGHLVPAAGYALD
jgi:hypothetical protein